MTKQKRNTGQAAHLGFEADLFKAADKLRGNMEPSDYKHVTLGLIFLKYISDAFEARYAELLAEDPQAAEDRDEYLADNVFWVPKEGRWSHLKANAKRPEIGTLIDDAMRAIERDNESLKGVLPKDYARPALNKVMLGELIDLISGIAMNESGDKSKDVLGRVYEYFLSQFAGAEGKRGGEFYTPRSVVQVLVQMLEPYSGRVYDPCCGSGGMFVQSENFVLEHGGRIGDIAIYGQESNYTTWRLAKMNLAVRGIDSDIRWNNEGSFHKNELRDLRFDYILANPPFNISDWGGDRLREDPRWQFGVPPVGNANYAWLQHIYWHLAPFGTAGVVLANGSMSSNQSGEGEIRKAMVEADAVDCMIALPGQLFYSTQIPACLWFLARDKSNGKRGQETLRDRRGEVLFIDARNMGALVDRTRRELSDADVQKIADTYHLWRGEALHGHSRESGNPDRYQDIPGFCKSATLEEIRKHGHVLTPGRYVGAAEQEDDGEPFEEKMRRLSAQWREQQHEAAQLEATIEANLKELGYGGEWQQIPLEDGMEALIDYRGKTPTKTHAGVPLITAKVVKNGRVERPNEFISHDDYDAWMRRGIPQAGDVLITTEAPLGEVAQLGSEKVALAQRLIALRGKNDVLDNTFLKFLLQSDSIQNQLRARASGSTVSGIKQSELRKINLLLPPPPEQRAIAHILGTLDDKIELNRRRNQTLEAMARALFKDWFVDFGPVRAKMEGREPYLPTDLWQLFPDSLDDEAKPEGWEMVPASGLIEFNPTEPLRKGTPTPYLDMASLPTSGSWPEPPIMRDFGSGMRFRNGDTLLARITPCLENGKTAFVQCLPDDTVGWGSTEYIVMRPKAPVPAEYAYLLARDNAFREHAIRSMTGTSGRQRAQRDSVAAFKLASPLDENLWHAFARQITPIFDSIKSNAKASETLSALRDTLLPKLISGELRIQDADKFLERAENNVPNKKRSLP